MVRSMTGFGEASAHEDGVNFFLEVRSLNSKYFKCTVRLPDDLQGLEPILESDIRRRLSRGTVTIVAKCSDASESAAHTVNHHALGRYIEQLRETRQVADGSVSIDLGALLTLPGVLQSPANEEERLERAERVLLKLAAEACEKVIAMRQREGEMLVSELMSHHELIAERLERISEKAPKVVQEYENRLRVRIDALLEDAKLRVEPADLIKEVAVYAERSDVAEEIARLCGHLEQFESLLKEADDRPIGRTLDFLSQEMLREANTIASKSGDSAISRDIVEIKGAIDRIKEQVQNVE